MKYVGAILAYALAAGCLFLALTGCVSTPREQRWEFCNTRADAMPFEPWVWNKRQGWFVAHDRSRCKVSG